MIRFCLIGFLIAAVNITHGQYTGGSNDGYSFASASNQNPLPNIYFGGNDDGISRSTATNQNLPPNIYTGGSDDGFSQTSAMNQNPLPNVYTGGSDDGFSGVLVSNQNPPPLTVTCPADISVQCIEEASCPPGITEFLALPGVSVSGFCSSNLSLSCSVVLSSGNDCTGTYIRTFIVTDDCGNSASCTQLISVNDNTPPEVLTQNISIYLDIAGTAVITPEEVDNNSTDNCSSITLSLNTTTFNSSNTGTNTVILTATDQCGNSASASAVITINPRPSIIEYTGDNDEQYSDYSSLSAVLKDQLTNTVLAGKTVQFIIGSQEISAITDASGIAATTMPIYLDAGDYDVTASFAGDAVYAPVSATEDYDVLKENASVEYTGPEFISVPCSTCTTTTILLSALLKDTTSGMPPGDPYPGDIRKARVKFIDVNTLADLSGWITPGLLNPADTTKGAAIYLYTVTLPASGYDTYTIGIVVDCDNNGDGNYSGYAQSVICVSRSSLNEFITGGGHILPFTSGGAYASNPGRKVSFGFNVKYNKSMRNLQGKVNIIFRRGAETYQIKSTSITSLSINSINPCSKKAVFISRANLQNVSNPAVPPVSVLGNLHLQMKLEDNGEPGTSNDRIGIALFNGSILVYSSILPYNITQLLNSGNIEVHDGVNCPNNNRMNNFITYQNPIKETFSRDQLLEVNVWPNPSEDYFNLQIPGGNEEPVTITAIDMTGQQLKQLYGKDGEIFRFGYGWKAGIYAAIIRLGRQRYVVKLIKR